MSTSLGKDITEFGQSAAVAVVTIIVRCSPVLNQSIGLSNEGFTCAFTHRITGSYRLLFGAGREMDDLALCPCLKRNAWFQDKLKARNALRERAGDVDAYLVFQKHLLIDDVSFHRL